MKLTTRDYPLPSAILFGVLCGTVGLTTMIIVLWFTSNLLIATPTGLVVTLGFHFYVWHT